MSIVKSFSVGLGDMFYIKHNSDNFTMIDCCLNQNNKINVVKELKEQSSSKSIQRFISTHPDDDHIAGLEYLDDEINILNFYCVNNNAVKEDETDDFIRYCELRDSSKKAFYLYRGCSRCWMNENTSERGSSGINVLWPIVTNEHFISSLQEANDGKSPNNISPIIKYGLEDGVKMIWMGDLKTDFMEKISEDLNLPSIDVLFAPHHGRESGKVPDKFLNEMDPGLIIIGEAPSDDLDYYSDYNTITQNSAGNIVFECIGSKMHIYVSNSNYSVNFLDNENMTTYNNYIGTLSIE